MGPTTKTPRKRQAPSQAGPKTKEAHVEKSERLHADVSASQKGKKRSQPITRPMHESEDSDLEVTDGGDLEDGEQSAGDELSADELPQSGEAPTKDPNGEHNLAGHM